MPADHVEASEWRAMLREWRALLFWEIVVTVLTLVMVRHNLGLAVSVAVIDLAGLLHLAPNSVSTLANAMTGAGMLDRSPGATDKRTAAFTLTPQGAHLVGQWRGTNSALLQSAIAVLNSRDRQILADALPVLERLVAVIDEQAQTPAPTHTATSREIGRLSP